MKKIFSLILVSVLLVTNITGCESKEKDLPATQVSSEKKDDEVVTLTFWDENADASRTAYYAEMIEKFEASQDRIKIEYLGLPSNEALAKYNTAIHGNSTPDVGGMNNSFASTIIMQDACLPLDEFFGEWDEGENINSSLLNIARQYHKDGKLYMLPISSNFINLWYNVEAFEEKGLTGPPQTWDEFFEYAELLTDESKGQYGYTIRGGSASAAIILDFLYSYSGIESVFDEDGNCTINDPKHVEFLEKYLSMYGKYTPESDITAGWKEIAANFGSGTSAMLTHNLGSYSNHMEAFGDKSKFMSAPLPTSASGKYINNGSAITGFSIFKNTKHPKEAWEFVSFLAGAEMQSFWNEKIGQMPTNSAVLEDEWVADMQHIYVAIETLNQSNTVSYAPPAFLPGFGSINQTYVEPGIQKVMGGEMTAQELLDMWAEYLTEEYISYQSAQ